MAAALKMQILRCEFIGVPRVWVTKVRKLKTYRQFSTLPSQPLSWPVAFGPVGHTKPLQRQYGRYFDARYFSSKSCAALFPLAADCCNRWFTAIHDAKAA